MNSFSYEELIEKASNCVLDHNVSLGDCSGKSNIPLPPPNGSVTFVQFKIEAGTVFGILSADHILRGLKIGRNDNREFIGLSKLQDGKSIACSVTFRFCYSIASVDQISSSSDSYRPDIGFIALGLNQFPKHELLANSKFYDLDSNKEFGFAKDPKIISMFLRGACHDIEISTNSFLKTPLCIGGGEVIRYDDEKDIQYWEIPNTSKKSIGGGSGAGFWRFSFKDNLLLKSFEGVIIVESKKYDSIEAMSPPYLYDNFLPT